LLHWTHQSVVKPGRNGGTYPIDSNAYRKIAIQMRVTQRNVPLPPDHVTVYGRHELLVDPGSYEKGGSAWLEPQIPAGSSDGIYVVDLVAAPTQGPDDAYDLAPVRGLHIDPTNTDELKDLAIDWVRLTAADNDRNALRIPVAIANCTGFEYL